MRQPRLKPENRDTYMHVYNRTAGTAGNYPFGRVEKEVFIQRLRKLSRYYVVEVLAYQVMGNHYHVLLFIPGEPPSNEEAARRHQRYCGRTIDPHSDECAALAKKLRDISEFMKDLQQPFTRWFNRSRSVRRRGHLWGDRYKNTVLENGLSVWRCWKYIEMNPVRARMASNPSEYRFCSYGHWAATGRHPFEETVRTRFLPWFRSLNTEAGLGDIERELRIEFARLQALEDPAGPADIATALAVAAEKERFTTKLDRRVRYWVDGLVIGSERFVKETMAVVRGKAALTRRLVPAKEENGANAGIFCFKQLRVLVD